MTIRESFLRKIWGCDVLWQAKVRKFYPWKLYFSPIRKSQTLKYFLLNGICISGWLCGEWDIHDWELAIMIFMIRKFSWLLNYCSYGPHAEWMCLVGKLIHTISSDGMSRIYIIVDSRAGGWGLGMQSFFKQIYLTLSLIYMFRDPRAWSCGELSAQWMCYWGTTSF